MGQHVDTIEDADGIGIIAYDSMTPEEKDSVFKEAQEDNPVVP